jgi:hypothetical protein
LKVSAKTFPIPSITALRFPTSSLKGSDSTSGRGHLSDAPERVILDACQVAGPVPFVDDLPAWQILVTSSYP